MPVSGVRKFEESSHFCSVSKFVLGLLIFGNCSIRIKKKKAARTELNKLLEKYMNIMMIMKCFYSIFHPY